MMEPTPSNTENPPESSPDDLVSSEPASFESSADASSQYTPASIRQCVQELLRIGVIDQASKPNVYKSALEHRAEINACLEPLDFQIKLDDVRGLAILAVSDTLLAKSEEDAWSHPLIRKQRLTLEQSLVIALLRQHYINFEQTHGAGSTGMVLSLDDIQSQFNLYFGDTGSDLKNEKKLRSVLDRLKEYSIVSEIDPKEQFTVRPLITHIADPQSLGGLLSQLQALRTPDSSHSSDSEDDSAHE